MELSGRLQELQNEVNCMNDSKDFQYDESVRSGNSHATSQPMLFPKHPAFEGLLRRSFISQRQNDGPPNIWDTSGVEESYPTPHMHEQMTTSNYGYDTAYNFTHNNIMLEPNAMNNIDTVAHMNVHNTQY